MTFGRLKILLTSHLMCLWLPTILPNWLRHTSVQTSQLKLSQINSGSTSSVYTAFLNASIQTRVPTSKSSLIAEMLIAAGVQKSRTTPYHPMGNGAVERFNRTLGGMIRALPPKAKHRWPQHLKSLTFAYNATVHETTGFAPFQLMFGRTPRLPVDLLFGSVLQDDQLVDYDAYVQGLRHDLAEAIKIAQTTSTKQQQRQAALYNRKFRGAAVEVGDRVL